ncbi:hypothetical protein [Bradymonas sediminis]|uniref:Uncharacterized protein n=1 Tax=Bradymonas sediminis TaxID=1548548 RepID=A0A2Z4FQ64_9DELT|nr:hypothetical protein [Bradymonas sediminis]AWV90796.1 hypothetical protein DN745_16315 [Bradymonas sediminis]TDP75470.1 hypothetical protein DFR33_104338 [Bradymonas sediminis]
MQRYENSRRILGLLFAGALLSASACGGCSKKEVAEAPQEKSAEDPTDNAAAEASADTPDSARFDRLVYGLPIPPNPIGLFEEKDKVRVQVASSLEEVGAFFEKNFVDFEILYSRDQVHAVGLRDFMPRVYAYPYGPHSFVVYTRAKLKPEEVKQAEAKARAKNVPSPKQIAAYKKGDPILERTADGKLLAPGARWGEPYTPPPGSPLDTIHYRSNFGRPYGEWVSR